MENCTTIIKKRLAMGYIPILIEIHRQHLIATRHIRHACPANNVRPFLSHNLQLVINRRLVGPAHPVPHRRRQRLRPVGLVLHRRLGGPAQDILREAVAPPAAVRRADRCGTVAPLLQADIPVRGVVVVGG